MRWAKFGKKRYEVIHEKVHGMADVPGDPPAIYVDPTLRGMTHLETVIHESMHACLPNQSEEVVTSVARDIARFTWRLGYRRVKETKSEQG